jgi:hypothetical protein
MRRLIFTVLFLLASIQVFAQNYSPYCNLDSALRVKRSAKRISLIVPADNLTISDADAIAFIGCANEIRFLPDGTLDADAIAFRYGIWSSGTNPLQTNTDIFNFCQLVACQGESTPDQSGTFISFTNLVLNGPGDVAFIANVHKNSSKKPVPSLWVGSYENGSYVLTNVASVGDQAEGTSGVFTAFHNIALPDQARLIFLASFKSKNHKEDHKEKQGVWALNPDGSLSLLVAQGTPCANGSDVVTSFSLLNDSPSGVTRSYNQLNGDLIFKIFGKHSVTIVSVISSALTAIGQPLSVTETINLTNNINLTGVITILPRGTLDLGGGGTLSGASNLIINGGTLLLGGNGRTNSVDPTATLQLDGGTLSVSGAGAITRTAAQTFASLTLSANSTIDFANLSGNSSLTFGNITLNGNKLNIFDWGGSNSFNLNSNNLTFTDLGNINFYSGSTTNSVFLGSGTISGNMIVPSTNNTSTNSP